MGKKLPIGIQSFEKLIDEDFLYIDKTEYIYKLVHDSVPCFLSRPRRFGKSLLISTMRAYWEGKKELFEGLRIAELEKDNADAWQTYPVFYFDFNGQNYLEAGALERILGEQLSRFEDKYSLKAKDSYSPAERFRDLLIEAHKATGMRCVILVDEYDKPLLDLVDKKDLQEHNKAVFKGFFSTLKSFDEHIQFVFITGVTNFHKVSIFSDLNQLRDISLTNEYSGICGITEIELRSNFKQEISAIAERFDYTYEDCLKKLKSQYDGYHFSDEGDAVYNPFSLLNAFADKDFASYWFSTGTPTFLIKQLKENHFELNRFTDGTIFANDSMLKDYTGDSLDEVPLLYQAGYLTIRDFNRETREYSLAFPNEEVKYGFLEGFMPAYVPKARPGSGLDIFSLRRHIEAGDIEKVMNVFIGLFANITYTLESDPFEHYFQMVIYLVFTLLGKFTICEMHTYTGRVDCVLQAKKYIYLFEFKRDANVDEALAQIEDNHYADAFIGDERKLFKIGATFDSKSRILSEWKVI